MIAPPYFEHIRRASEQRWDQLEADRELAGPWHQLFAQVQSPRHVLSELLQNADDAGATEATVQLDGDCFHFSHNGVDFTEEHFQSLCRFAYSNKRTLHTIGFRGIGFKSTFSLGHRVELRTPTLSVAFHRDRFTQPHWIEGVAPGDSWTRVRVPVGDSSRSAEVEKNLRDWVESPVSLLFFRNLRKLSIGTVELDWCSAGPGPTPESEWVALSSKPDELHLVVHSDGLCFPEEAKVEISHERQLVADGEVEFPPCSVEIVLGARGRLYVVLATGVSTALPFACNAPFIQDPARLKIKDPATSPTNRWLLQQVGELAAKAMLAWLGDQGSSIASRSEAYGLFPDVNRQDTSLEGSCATIVEEAFEAVAEGAAYLLTASGQLEPAGRCVILPDELIDVWPTEQAAALLDSDGRRALSPLVSHQHRKKLLNWKLIGSISADDVVETLTSTSLPAPARWEQLLRLWSYVAPKMLPYPWKRDWSQLRIVPAQGQDTLCAAVKVVRLGEGRLLQSDADWEFLSDHLLVLDPNWPRFLAKRRREAEADEAQPATRWAVEAAYGVLKTIGLEEASDHSTVMDRVASEFFRASTFTIADMVRLAQIAAKLGATIGASFRYATRDKKVRRASDYIIHDPHGRAEALLLPAWAEMHLLHPEYSGPARACTDTEWREWASSEHSRLRAFLPLTQVPVLFEDLSDLATELVRRGVSGGVAPPYRSQVYFLEDWDFDAHHWRHWRDLATADPDVFARVLRFVLDQPVSRWRGATSARAYQEARTGRKKQVTNEAIVPGWILKFREQPCLPDTRDVLRKPAELLRRTEATEALIDVEPFVHRRFDTEALRPLLKLLGVGDQPTGPATLLARLRALAKSDRPPVGEVERWYRRLDQMLDTCSTESREAIRQTLISEALVLTENKEWACGSDVFQSANDEDAPGAALVLPSVRGLALWSRVGIPERPTADLALNWLRSLPSRTRLAGSELNRVRALLGRHSARVWNETRHWLALSDEWVPTEDLTFSVTMASLAAWSHLFPRILGATADLRALTAESASAAEFADLKSLASYLEERPAPALQTAGRAEFPASWLRQFGRDLRRIRRDDPRDEDYLRARGAELAATECWTVPKVHVVPFLDGTPAGAARTTDVLWHDSTLYVQDLPAARLARLVPDRIGQMLRSPELTHALHYCFERSPEQVTAYLQENFTLDEAPPLTAVATASGASLAAASEETHPERAGSIGSDADLGPGEKETMAMTAAAGDDSDADAEPTLAEEKSNSRRDHPHSRSTLPSLIDRFARGNGFEPNGANTYVHPCGDRLVRVADEPFPWEWRTTTGERRCAYWPKEHCLDRQPLQLPSELWDLIEQRPERYALLLTDAGDRPREFRGSALREMRANGQLTLYPAAYRLVVDQNA